MNKLIFLIAILIACGAMLFFYLNEDNISLPSAMNEQEKQFPDKNRIPPPSPPIIPAPKTDSPPTPRFSDKLSSSPTLDKKSADIKKKTELNPLKNEKKKTKLDPIEDEVESINSYPIEDAEIYFVPPDQRYPGNLGGPPPLDIPDSR
ncbi:MAG: hypothetical protein V3U87_16350 [Methylococcaceae bacterium]